MIVADANLIAYVLLPGERSEEAEAVLARDPIWVVPILWRSELRSVVHKYVVRGNLTVSRAVFLLGQAEEIIEGRESHVDSRSVLELASRSSCTTYDCEYVALARDLNVPLVTADRAVLKAFPEHAVALREFLES